MIARLKRRERPAAIPSGTPIRIDRPTAASMSANVSMLSAHRPEIANVANAPSAQAPAQPVG